VAVAELAVVVVAPALHSPVPNQHNTDLLRASEDHCEVGLLQRKGGESLMTGMQTHIPHTFSIPVEFNVSSVRHAACAAWRQLASVAPH